jgi:hypothetical protein
MSATAPVARKVRFKTEIGQLHYDVLDELVETLKDGLGDGKEMDGLDIRNQHESLYFQQVMARFPKSSTKDSDDYHGAVRYLHNRHAVFDGIYGPRSQYQNEWTTSDGAKKAIRKETPKFDTPAALDALRMWGVTIINDYETANGSQH